MSKNIIGERDERAIYLNTLLSERVRANRERDAASEYKYLIALSRELKKLDEEGVTKTYVKMSYDGGAKGKGERTIAHLQLKVQQDLKKFADKTIDTKDDTATPSSATPGAPSPPENKDALTPTTIAPTQLPTLPAYSNRAARKQLSTFMTRTKKLDITPQDYIKSLDLEQLTALPPSLIANPAFRDMIMERKQKLERKAKAQEKLLYEKELEAQKKIEASKQAFDEHHETDNYEIAPSDLYIRNIDHLNPIMMRQFQFDPPDNIPVQVKNLQEKDTLRRATKIKIYDDEPKTTLAAAAKLEKPMRDRLRKPKVKFEPSNEQRQPLQSLAPINKGESGLDMSEMYELLGFQANGSRDPNSEAYLRYVRDKY